MKFIFVFSALSTLAVAQNVTMTVHSYAGDGPANLVSNAVPLRPGVIYDDRNLRVMDGSTEVRVATRVLALWPQDQSIRSLLVQFSAPSAKAYTLQIGSSRTTADLPLTAVTWNVPTRIFTLPAKYLSESLIFWEQKPHGETGFPAWETKQLQNYSRISTPGTAPCVRDDQYYDAITTTYQMYVRTGDLQYLVNGRRWALHHRKDQIYLSGSSIGHPRCSGGYLNNTRYTFPQGLASDYFMFGDDEDKRVSALVVDNFYMSSSFSWWYYKAPNTRGFWTEREPAFALMGILAHYEATNDARYLNFARAQVTSLHRMQVENGRRAWVHNLYDHDPDEGCATTDYGSSPWMSGLLLEAIIKYHKLTSDPTARESILMALDDLKGRYLARGDYAGKSFVYLGCSAYSDGTPDLDNLISHAFGYGYKLTGAPDYLKVGTDIFNTAVAEGYAGAHKQFDQQFRSSGLFVGYVGTASAPPDTTAPTVAVTSPTAGQSVSGTITATASATDNVGVAGVQFLMDGQTYGVEDASAPYAVSVDTRSFSNGSHTISARARDAAGNVRVSSAITVTVNNTSADTTAPTVAVTSPAAGQSVAGSITATASATDNVGVSGVQFLVDGQAFGAEDTAAPYSVAVNTTSLTNGNHTIAARARDASGNVRTSAAVTFTVNNISGADKTAPAVAVTSPQAGQSVLGSITATASATDNVGVAGVQFLVDGRAYGAEDVAAPYTVALNASTLTKGQHTIAARARDASGNVRTSVSVAFLVGVIRVNSGGPAFTDPENLVWAADYGFDRGAVYSTTTPIASTTADGMYQSQRYSSTPLTYAFNMANGTYNIYLKFAEIQGATRGQRVFNVQVNGSTVLANFDVYAAGGSANLAVKRTIPVSVTNGRIEIKFVPVVSAAIVNAIEIGQ